MKLLTVISAGLVATALLAGPASADHHHGWKTKRVCKMVRDHGHMHKVCHNERVRW